MKNYLLRNLTGTTTFCILASGCVVSSQQNPLAIPSPAPTVTVRSTPSYLPLPPSAGTSGTQSPYVQSPYSNTYSQNYSNNNRNTSSTTTSSTNQNTTTNSSGTSTSTTTTQNNTTQSNQQTSQNSSATGTQMFNGVTDIAFEVKSNSVLQVSCNSNYFVNQTNLKDGIWGMWNPNEIRLCTQKTTTAARIVDLFITDNECPRWYNTNYDWRRVDIDLNSHFEKYGTRYDWNAGTLKSAAIWPFQGEEQPRYLCVARSYDIKNTGLEDLTVTSNTCPSGYSEVRGVHSGISSDINKTLGGPPPKKAFCAKWKR